jgi:large subunit ribosomal protein L3
MLSRIFGKKLGMTQIFLDTGEVVPVTVINVANLFVTQVKTLEKDGYAALQIGLLRNKYTKHPFDKDWCLNKKKYFLHLSEVLVDGVNVVKFKIGQEIKLDTVNFNKGGEVKITGKSRGLGFQGVVKRWNFSGGPSSHGSNFHRIPGSMGGMCSQGKVFKGKKLPGHCGCKQTTIKGLTILDINKDGYLFVKGSVPGKKDSLVFISKQG